MGSWEEAQRAESEWWGDCRSTLVDDLKQVDIAPYLGIPLNRWMQGNIEGRSVVDLGGGPSSLLLKCQNIGAGSVVVDPCSYPDWTRARYAAVGVDVYRIPVEDLSPIQRWDEAWCYNVLQHVRDVEAFLTVARAVAPVLRLFEWINVPADQWHPHVLTRERLEAVLGARSVVTLDGLAHGEAFFGVFERG